MDAVIYFLIIIIALCALIETGWEMFEFGVDELRLDIMHQNLIDINQLLQPSNSDTMGDETFNLAGGLVAIALLALSQPKILADSDQDAPLMII